MTAPARAAYEAFQHAFPDEDWGPWEERTAEEQDGWGEIAAAASGRFPGFPDSIAPGDVMTPGEVNKLFGVDPTTVMRWGDSGLLACTRTPGGHRRYLRSSVEALRAVRAARAAERTGGRDGGS